MVRGKAADGEIGGDEVGAVDVESVQKVEVYQVVNAAVPRFLRNSLQKRPYLQKSRITFLLQVDLITADAVGPVVIEITLLCF
jgi:hypothetical protein